MARTVSGRIWDANGLHEGHVRLDEAGRVHRIEQAPSQDADLEGLVVPAPVNAHTHLADHAIRGAADGLTIEDAVAPPGGLKHRFLRDADPEALYASFRSGLAEVEQSGARAVIDFREGGPAGASIADQARRGSRVDVTVLGRPSTPSSWEEEAPKLVDLVDGLGVSGLNDQPSSITEDQAAWCHENDLPLALHVSEGEREDLEAALALDPDVLVHGTHFTKTDAGRLAEAGVPLVACPRANAKFGNKPPLPLLEEQGVAWQLGTDNALFHEANVWNEASLIAKRHPEIPAQRLLEALTTSPLQGEPPRLQEGTPVVVLDDADGLDHALENRRVTVPWRENLANEEPRTTSLSAPADSDRRE